VPKPKDLWVFLLEKNGKEGMKRATEEVRYESGRKTRTFGTRTLIFGEDGVCAEEIPRRRSEQKAVYPPEPKP